MEKAGNVVVAAIPLLALTSLCLMDYGIREYDPARHAFFYLGARAMLISIIGGTIGGFICLIRQKHAFWALVAAVNVGIGFVFIEYLIEVMHY